MYKKALFLLVVLFSSFESIAQCTSGCTYTYSGVSPNNNTNVNLNGNQKLCITGNAGNLSINFNGSNNSICINDGVTWTQSNGLNFSAGTIIDVNGGTFTWSGSNNFNGSGNVINVGTSGTLNMGMTNAPFNGNMSINNAGNLNFTAGGTQTMTRLNLTNSGTVTKSSGKLFFDKGSVSNSGTMNIAVLENQEMSAFDNIGTLNVSGEYYSHGKFNNTGSVTIGGGLRVGDKGPGDFVNNNLITVSGGLLFQGSGNIQNNGGIDILTGNLTGNGVITGDGSGNNYIQVVNGTNTNSGSVTNNQIFVGTTPTSPFPIKAYNLKAQKLEDEVQLSWEATDASGFSHFEIQRSTDAVSFESIGREKYNQELQKKSATFNFRDINPIEGLNYYRLRMVDLDGSVNFSKIIVFDFEIGAEYIYFQNPTESQEILLHTNIKNPEISIIDNLGRDVKYSISKNGSSWSIKPKRYYYDTVLLRVKGDEKTFIKRVVLR